MSLQQQHAHLQQPLPLRQRLRLQQQQHCDTNANDNANDNDNVIIIRDDNNCNDELAFLSACLMGNLAAVQTTIPIINNNIVNNGLMIAITQNESAVVKYLLHERRVKLPCTAIMHAVHSGTPEMVELLLTSTTEHSSAALESSLSHVATAAATSAAAATVGQDRSTTISNLLERHTKTVNGRIRVRKTSIRHSRRGNRRIRLSEVRELQKCANNFLLC